jgi:hypothetical protein
MKFNKDLGVSPKERFKDIASPSQMGETVYPSFHYSGPDELGLPDEGEMTIKFKKVSQTRSERNGVHHYKCTIEVREIRDVDAEDVKPPSRRNSEAGDALDKIAQALHDAREDADEEDSDDY